MCHIGREMKPTIIYGLIDPRNNQLRYIGKTTCGLQRRLRLHLTRRNLTPKRHSSRWLAGLVAAGMEPEIFSIEEIAAVGDWVEAEQFWISYFRFIGADLTNLVDGGEGVSGYRFSEERKRQLSELFKGRQFDDVWKAKISAAKKGVPGKQQRPETIAARVKSIRETLKAKADARTHCTNGHEFTAENTISNRRSFKACRTCKRLAGLERHHRIKPPLKTKQEISLSLRLSMARPEVRQRMSVAAKRKFENPEFCERHAASRRGKASSMRGDKSPSAKLNWEKVGEIRNRCGNGEPRQRVAREFGVCPAVVDRIIWNQTWKSEHQAKSLGPG